MKKFLFSFFILFVISFNVFAQVGGRLVVISVLDDQVDKADAWVGNIVEERLEANLSKYTDFSIVVDDATKEQIKEIQKESENLEYDESTIIDAGEFVNATHKLVATIRKNWGKYTLSVKITDLKQGIDIVNTLPVESDSAEGLAGYYGCAVDQITIAICESLGIELTPTQKHVILSGEIGLTGNEKSAVYDDDARLYTEQIRNLTSEINLAAKQTDEDAEVRQKALEAQKKFAEEKLRLVKEKQKRIKDEQRRLAEEEANDAKRSEEQRKRIMDTSFALADKMKELRKSFENKQSLLSEIKKIESTKQVFVELSDEAAYQRQIIIDEAEYDIENKFLEIDSRPLEEIEMSNGVITEAASRNREREFEKFRAKRMGQAEADINRVDKLTIEQQENLIKDINKAYKNIEEGYITTINDELIIDYSTFDGSTLGWDVNVTVQNEDIIIFQTKSFLSYEDITGKKAVTDDQQEGYKEFNDDVKFITSMISRGEPLFTFAIDVVVTPSDKSHPSEYTFSFDNLRAYNTLDIAIKKNKIVAHHNAKLSTKDESIIRQMEPAYDIHTKEELDAEAREYQRYLKDLENENERLEEKARKQREKDIAESRKQQEKDKEAYQKRQEQERKERKQRAEEEKRREAKEQKKIARKEAIRKRPEEKNYKHSLIGINGGYSFTDTTATSVGLELATGICPFIYFDYKANLLNIDPKKSNYYPITDPKMNFVLSNMFQLGLNIPMGGIFEMFGSGGVGFNWYCPVSVFKNDGELFDKFDQMTQKSIIDLTYGFSAGLSIEIVRHLALVSSYNMIVVHEKDHIYNTVDVGIAFVF